MTGFFQDLRYALRQFRKAPGFTLIAVLSLTLGIGATTAVFSIVYVSLIHPYPFRDWERLVTLTVRDQNGKLRTPSITGGQLLQLREAAPIEEVMAFSWQNLTITGGDLPEDVSVLSWTTNATSYFGVFPTLGRGVIPSDAPEGQDPQPVAVVSYLFWQRHFGGNPDVVGQSIELSHMTYRIVGVMSPRMGWGGADVYLPLKVTRDPNLRLNTSIRLKPGVSTETASTLLQPLLDAFAKETPSNFPPRFHVNILPLSYGIVTGLGPSLYLLFGAVCLLLLIGCLNVSILLMARGTRRQYEMAIRAAMGAARMRVVRQLLTESLLLAAMGEALGIALAYAMQRMLIRELPAYLAVRQASIHLNLPVLSFSMAATLVTVLVFGLLPALQFSRRDLRNTMQLGVQRIAGGWGKHTRNALIGGQIALSLMLLAGAATSIRAFVRLLHANLGYDPQNALALAIPIHQNSYTTWEQRAVFLDRIQQKIASTPGVIAAGISIAAVPPSSGWNAGFEIQGENILGDQQVRTNYVGHEYFSALAIPLLQGRLWDRAETMRGAHLVVINQTMARQYWPHGNSVGSQIRFPRLISEPPNQISATGSDQWLEVVGVVGDSLNDGLRNPVKPAVYLPYTLRMPMYGQLVVKTQANPLLLLRTLREQVRSVDPEQQVMNGSISLEEGIEQEMDWQREHMVALLFGAFSAITLALAALGLYSVVSYIVAQRTSEFALRMALGAQRGDVLVSALMSTIYIVGAGVAVGVGLYLLVNRIVARLAEAPSSDLLGLLVVAPLLVVVAALACYLPARRAMALDPASALRYE